MESGKQRVFVGKFSKHYPKQIEQKVYVAGKEGNKWYGDVKLGDYVFISHGGEIIALWRAKEYGKAENIVVGQTEGLYFEEIKTYSNVRIVDDFTRYKHFVYNLNLVNQAIKSTPSKGFIPIEVSANCPNIEDIDFKQGKINLYITTQNKQAEYKDGDIRIVVDDVNNMAIIRFEQYRNNGFVEYSNLKNLYEQKNSINKRYTIKQLKDYSIFDEAPRKEEFLKHIITELQQNEFVKIENAVRLYDNLLVGRKVTKSSKKNIKSPNVTQDEIIEIDEQYAYDEQYDRFVELLEFNPNIILYGPPGTGKTYSSTKIVNNFEQKEDKTSNFKKASEEGRVKFITFHQSYSYEEFIEGIRPVLSSDGGENGIGYKLEDGIFKKLCDDARLNHKKSESDIEDKIRDMITPDSKVWKMSLGERSNDKRLYNECVENGEIGIGWLDEDLSGFDNGNILEALTKQDLEIENKKGVPWGDKPKQTASTINDFINNMQLGDIVFIYDSPKQIRNIGIITSEYEYRAEKSQDKHRRKVKWLKNINYPINIFEYNKKINLTMKTVYELNRITIENVMEIIEKNKISNEKQQTNISKVTKPYYIIIDEINRGNISKIFGELITLIEKDKRNKQKVVLPYSKKTFTVPNGLYIIGTMNTADRSIATIDTALRRRFTFVEIEPNAEVLMQGDNSSKIGDVDLVNLLNSLNEKVINFYDKDHRIGHSYFMNIVGLKELYNVWYYNILPLLGEYFYNDVEKLRVIVGDAFYDKQGNVNYLDTVNLKDFEKAIIKIYDGKKDE